MSNLERQKKMTSISQKEDELFKEWRKRRVGFVSDGLPNEEAYLSSDHKLLFILKEANDRSGGGWDLRDFVREGGRAQTWNNVSRWVHGIRNLGHVPNWQFYENISKEFRIENLQSIAAVNLKKSPGGQTSDHGILWKVIQEDQELIRSQVSFYDAELTICCGTGPMYLWIMSQGHQGLTWKSTSRGIDYFRSNEDRIVLSFPHPAARIKGSILFYALIDAITELWDVNPT